jgi:hypothetical protein
MGGHRRIGEHVQLLHGPLVACCSSPLSRLESGTLRASFRGRVTIPRFMVIEGSNSVTLPRWDKRKATGSYL